MRHLSEKMSEGCNAASGRFSRGGLASAGLRSAVDPLTNWRAGSFFANGIILNLVLVNSLEYR